MKALTRNKGETITEEMNVPGINWKTGMPLTNPCWAGGPYTMIMDYNPPAEDEETITSNPDAERNAEIAELKARLAALESDL